MMTEIKAMEKETQWNDLQHAVCLSLCFFLLRLIFQKTRIKDGAAVTPVS